MSGLKILDLVIQFIDLMNIPSKALAVEVVLTLELMNLSDYVDQNPSELDVFLYDSLKVPSISLV